MAWFHRLLRVLRHPLTWLLGGLSLAMAATWGCLLCFPAPLFSHALKAEGLTLRSDRPFDAEAGRRILAEVRARGLGSGAEICIAQAEWRRRLCFLGHSGAIGISYPFTRNVFIRSSRIERDRVVHREGWEVGGYFTLTHVIGHELGHVQMYRRLGAWQTLVHVPMWLCEGWAEYAGGISDFDFERDAQAFLADAPSMQSPRPNAPPYRRLYLLTSFLVEKQGWSLERMAREKPDQVQIEAALRAWLQARPQPSKS